MAHSIRTVVARTALVSFAALLLLGCGGERPSQQAAATSEPAPAATQVAEAAPPPAAPPAASPTPTVVPPAEPKPTPAPKPKPEPAPKPAPKPEAVTKTLVVGTEIAIEMTDPVSSKTSQVGDAVRARVTAPVSLDGLTVVPAGAVVSGTVTEAVPLKKIGGAASLGLKFDRLELPSGTPVPLAATIQLKGKSESGKDAGTIAGATAGGALLGRLLSKDDKTKGTLIGAAVGAAAGTGAAAATKGQEVELATGTPMTLKLQAPADVLVRL